ncbi:SCO5389 family protein [Fodinicola feengrottensis]|nr:SCO5389 family protein [Fodinicola feengrottensis]
MSLTVSPELLERATAGPVDDADFVACIKESLPYAYRTVARVADDLASGKTAEGRPFADNQVEPPTEQDRGATAARHGERLDPGRAGAAFRDSAGLPELPPGGRRPRPTRPPMRP